MKKAALTAVGTGGCAIETLDRAGNPWLRCIKRELNARRTGGRRMGGVA